MCLLGLQENNCMYIRELCTTSKLNTICTKNNTSSSDPHSPFPPQRHQTILNTTPRNTRRRILNMSRQRTSPTKQSFYKLRGDHIRSSRTRMRMINRIIRIHNSSAQRNKSVRKILPMIDKRTRTPRIRNHILTIPRKARRSIATCARFTRIVWCRTRNDNVCAFCDQSFGGVGEICHVGLDHHARGCGAGL